MEAIHHIIQSGCPWSLPTTLHLLLIVCIALKIQNTLLSLCICFLNYKLQGFLSCLPVRSKD